MNRTAQILSGALISVFSALGTHAANPAGFYLGAGAIRGETKASYLSSFPASGFEYREHSTSWKGVVGIRPLSLIGAEVEYIDFGSTTVEELLKLRPVNGELAATSIFGVIYIPIPVPSLDLFAKVGYSRLRGHVISPAPSPPRSCIAISPAPWYCGPTVNIDLGDETLTSGIGAQWRLGSWGLRGEYERFMPSGPDPTVVSLLLTKTLF